MPETNYSHLVMVVPPGENIAPVRQIVGGHRQSISPGLDDGLHVVEGVVPAEIGGLQALVDLDIRGQFDNPVSESGTFGTTSLWTDNNPILD